ncbi:unnamed protein product [Symbiodinium microadriaticum]|nr:unnamed protein product [Symbiodinium microadriaticum]
MVEGRHGCWLAGFPYSHYFLCCAKPEHWRTSLKSPDCWENGWARGSREACCPEDPSARLDAKAAQLAYGIASASAPCASADATIKAYLAEAVDRLLYQGMPSASPEWEVIEQRLLANADATYEACPAALLLMLASQVCRWTARSAGTDQIEHTGLDWYRLFELWNSLVWSDKLAWSNLMDPLIRTMLHAAASYIQMLNVLVLKPARTCENFQNNMAELIIDADGLSLTTSASTGSNINTYPDLSRFALLLASHGHLVTAEHSCDTARVMACVFNARRFLDIRADLAHVHIAQATLAETEAARHFPRSAEGGVIYPGAWRALMALQQGLQQQLQWQDEEHDTNISLPLWAASSPTELGPLSLWEPSLTSVFSAALNDGVLERLLALLGPGQRQFVEIGTQLGDQCNTRYLRARHGFHGLMIDDNFGNADINLTTHRVTPENVVSLFQEFMVPSTFDVLSLDTDGNQWLLWLNLCRVGQYRPRIVMIEFGSHLPYDEDVAVRYSSYPVHQLCLANRGKLPSLVSASVTTLRNVGRALGYVLVHLGRVDLTFVREDVLKSSGLSFPSQDDPAGLCALARYQARGRSKLLEACAMGWRTKPAQEILTNASAALSGDYFLNNTDWPVERAFFMHPVFGYGSQHPHWKRCSSRSHMEQDGRTASAILW